MHILFMACYTDDCEQKGGGWVKIRTNTRKEIYQAMEQQDPGDCPDCGEMLNYEIHVDEKEEK